MDHILWDPSRLKISLVIIFWEQKAKTFEPSFWKTLYIEAIYLVSGRRHRGWLISCYIWFKVTFYIGISQDWWKYLQVLTLDNSGKSRCVFKTTDLHLQLPLITTSCMLWSPHSACLYHHLQHAWAPPSACSDHHLKLALVSSLKSFKSTWKSVLEVVIY